MTSTGTLAQMQGISRQREPYSGKDDAAVGRSVSFTLTIEEPRAVKWLSERMEMISPAEIGAQFVEFLIQRDGKRNDDLLQLAGSWVDDPEAEKAIAEMDRVDEELWK